MLKLAWLGIALISSSLWAAEIGQRFASVAAYVKSLPNGEAQPQQSYGDLAGLGRRDWVGVVHLDDPKEGRSRQIVVLTQNAEGQYVLAAHGPHTSTNEGTSHVSLDEVTINRGSFFVSWSWYWHGCGGHSRQQIKLYDNQWRVIGAEISQSNSTIDDDGAYDTGDSAELSNNLLTGTAVIHSKPHQKRAVTKTMHKQPSVVLFNEKFDEDTGDVDEFADYARCNG